MSNLKKAIERAGRRESTPMGFTRVTLEKRRAMLLCVQADSEKDAAKASEAGADVVLVGTDAGKAEAALKAAGKAVSGVVTGDLTNDGAAKLAGTGADFIASPFETTVATAVDTNRTGHVIVLDGNHDDATLRALAPLGLDALLVDRGPESLTLQQQAKFVRIAQLTSTPLLFRVAPSIEVDELRVLRDSGGAGVVLPAGSAAADIEAVDKRLREVPDPRRTERSSDIAVLPSLLGGVGGEHDDDDDGDEPDDE